MHVEDLKIGMWVAVGQLRQHPTEGEGWFSRPRHVPCGVDGRPLRIVAISLPFVCVEVLHHHIAIDTREVDFIRLDDDYVEAMQQKQLMFRPKVVEFGTIDSLTEGD